MSYQFKVEHHGQSDRLGLAAELQAFADQEWTAEHMTPEQAAHAILDRFTRVVRQEIELLEVAAEPIRKTGQL